MKIGEKIRKIRDIKGLSQENLAEALNMTPAGYSKIERNEVDVNMERLTQISEVLQVKIEDIINFDDRIVYNNYTSGDNSSGHYIMGDYHNNLLATELKNLYEDKIKLLNDKISLLEELIALKKN